MTTPKERQADHWLAFVLFTHRDPAGREYGQEHVLAARTSREAVGLAAQEAGLTPGQAVQLDRDGELWLDEGEDPYSWIEILPCGGPEQDDCQLAEHSDDEGPRFVPVIDSAVLDSGSWCHCHRGSGEALGRG